MQSLGLDVEVLSEEGRKVRVSGSEDEIMKTVEELGINLEGHMKSVDDGKELVSEQEEGKEKKEEKEPAGSDAVSRVEEKDEEKSEPELTDEEKELK